MEKIKNLKKGTRFKLRPDLGTKRRVADHDLRVIWEVGENELDDFYAAYDVTAPNRMTFIPADIEVMPIDK